MVTPEANRPPPDYGERLDELVAVDDTCAQSRRLMTRRSQVQILPRYSQAPW